MEDFKHLRQRARTQINSYTCAHYEYERWIGKYRDEAMKKIARTPTTLGKCIQDADKFSGFFAGTEHGAFCLIEPIGELFSRCAESVPGGDPVANQAEQSAKGSTTRRLLKGS